MNGDDYRRLTPGGKLRKFPAQLFNDLVEMSKAYRAGKHNRQSEGISLPYNPTTCLIQNNSGDDVGQFAILGVDAGFVIGPSDNFANFQRRPIFKGITPALTSHRARFVVTLEPIADGKIGRAVIEGIVPCLFEVTSSTANARFARIIDGETTKLELSYAGLFPVNAIETGTGEKWGTVKIGGNPTRLVLGQTDTALTAPTTGTVSLYSGTKGSETDTGENLTALLLRYAELAAGQKCHVLCDETGEEILIGDPCAE